MTKIGIITDTHWGARSDNISFLDYTKTFLDSCFFPYLEEHNIKTVIHCGDLVDRRKYVNYYTANRMKKDFLLQLQKRDIDTHIIAGNHDTYYKGTNRVNALRELVAGKYPRIKSYSNVTEIEIDGIPILLVPWICDENREETLDRIRSTTSQICLGHLDLNGFEMYRGVYQREGFNPGIFDKFDIVCSGHFHHKHSRGNIHYLGSPLQFNWADYDDDRGFHILDLETRELAFVENPYVIFKKIWYNDKDKTIDDVIHNVDFDNYSSCFCKLIIEEKTNPYWFDMFVENLEKSDVTNLQIVEDHHNFDIESDIDIVSEAEDTLTIFKKAIEQMNTHTDKDKLFNTINDLYQEAMRLE